MKYFKSIYDRSPIFLQNLICSFRGWIESNRRFGGDFYERLERLKISEWNDEEDIANYQFAETKRLLIHAYNNVPYYRELFDGINFNINNFKSIRDLENIPILTKDMVRENYDKLKSKSLSERALISHTSGSTGKSLSFIFPISAIRMRWAIWFRHRARFGVKPSDKYATFTGLPAIPLTQKKPPFWRENYFARQTVFTMHHINNNSIFSIVDRLNKGDFIYYSGYPSIIYNLAVLIQENNLEIKNPPKVIFTGAETLLMHQREIISSVFKCLVTDQYGFSEGGCNASRCENDYFHEDFEYGLMECVDGKENSDGSVVGKIIATGFTNYAMPLIRYEVGDTATWTNVNCQCGRKTRTISQINGRNEDFILTPEGNRVQRFDYIFKNTPSIIEAQVLQFELDSIVIRIVRRYDYSINEMEAHLKNEVRDKVSVGLLVLFEYVERINLEQSGKFRAVKSLLK